MITSSKFYPFGGKVSTVETPAFSCMISTAKDGFFKKQSVRFLDFSAGMQQRQVVATLQYNDILDNNARLGFHDLITHALDESGMNGQTLREALCSLFQGLQKEGVGFGTIAEEL
jgi:hypothetical protein